ncbi:hypothetical protein Tsubulata_023663 [Turnera subulata]|uniref:BZIP domain-containing protein n=1 Tax=Turnera subulata TaxID=218843 RepID=A0A9Q0J397_9ROSI|nr:hypothetical protein Tsubulata_023663 [Turnera subulata]
MSRQLHLPPRCPLQKQPAAQSIHKAYHQHHKSPSQGSILEEQPEWLDDLLSDQDADSKGISHRRSVSDSVTFLDGLVDSLSGFNPPIDGGNSVSIETSSRLDSASVYGPNSPRRRGNVNFSESAVASALSEYAFQNPLQFVDGSLCLSSTNYSGSMGDACGSVGELNSEMKSAKRHSGQRSRVRKLQYIAELERTVEILQTLESELAVKVASLLQERVVLSKENGKLKQQVGRLKQEKVMLEGQYKNLKKEVAKLRSCLANSQSNKVRTYYGSSPPEAARSEVAWQMLDMAKLNLN